jgi:hypothetical protein
MPYACGSSFGRGIAPWIMLSRPYGTRLFFALTIPAVYRFRFLFAKAFTVCYVDF